MLPVWLHILCRPGVRAQALVPYKGSLSSGAALGAGQGAGPSAAADEADEEGPVRKKRKTGEGSKSKKGKEQQGKGSKEKGKGSKAGAQQVRRGRNSYCDAVVQVLRVNLVCPFLRTQWRHLR